MIRRGFSNVKCLVALFCIYFNSLASGERISVQKCNEFKLFYKVENHHPASLLNLPTKPSLKIYECGLQKGKVVAGEKAGNGEFPHMAAVGWLNQTTGKIKFICGGSLISERYVLTAAHCRINGPKIYYARLGTVSIADKSFNEITDYEVEEFVVHENYGTTAAYSDIGLLRLRKTVEFDKKLRFPACLQHTELTTTNATATGWGSMGNGTRTNDLLKVSLKVRSFTRCRFQVDDYSRICAGGTDDSSFPSELVADTCHGDSGGPIQVRHADCCYRILGLTAYGTMYCGRKAPAVYTNVSHFVDWIESHVWPASNKSLKFINTTSLNVTTTTTTTTITPSEARNVSVQLGANNSLFLIATLLLFFNSY